LKNISDRLQKTTNLQ